MEEGTVTLGTIGKGAAEELFAGELAKVLSNIEDVNTDHQAKRTITLQIVFTSDENRRVGAVVIKASSRLAGLRPATTIVYMGRQDNKLVAIENDPGQMGLFDDKNKSAGPIGLAAKGGRA